MKKNAVTACDICDNPVIICDNLLMFNVYICKTLINHSRYAVWSKKSEASAHF